MSQVIKQITSVMAEEKVKASEQLIIIICIVNMQVRTTKVIRQDIYREQCG